MKPEALDAQNAVVYTVRNYYFNGVGHISANYGKVMREGLQAVIAEAEKAKETFDYADAHQMKSLHFLESTIVANKAGIYAEGVGTFKSWISGLYQDAKSADSSPFDGEVAAWGVAGGVQVGYKGYELVASGFSGEALGSTLMLDYDSLDYTGEERESYGYLLQGTYPYDNRLGKTKFGIAYGANHMEETSAEKEVRTTTGFGELKQQVILPGF